MMRTPSRYALTALREQFGPSDALSPERTG